MNQHVRRPVRALSLFAGLWLASAPALAAGRADAVDCEAIVQATYWDLRHEGKGGPFPFERYVDALGQRADRTARLLSFLRDRRGKDVGPVELQLEIDRLVRDTRAPEALDKLFAALGNDPQLIGECLAKPVLVERLARQYFARDAVHDPVRAQAARELDAARATASTPTGEPGLRVALIPARLDHRVVPDTTAEGTTAIGMLREFNVVEWQVEPDTRQPRFSRVVEGERELRALRGDYRDGKLELRVLDWPKVAFDQWWATAKDGFAPDYRARASGGPKLVLPTLAEGQVAGWEPMREHDGFDIDAAFGTGVAVSTGAELLLWGGHLNQQDGRIIDGYPYTADGGAAYDPVADTWRGLSRLDAPRHQCGFARGLWTGTKLLVVIGRCPLRSHEDASQSTPVPAQAALYDPVADTWETLPPPPDSWNASSGFSAVWTGSKAIYYGGEDDFTPTHARLSIGAIFDPTSKAWSTFNISPAQIGLASSVRSRHSAVWTGTTMLVFGGNAANVDCEAPHSAFAFDPFTQSGSALPERPAGKRAPFGKVHWTGSEVVTYSPTYTTQSCGTDQVAGAWRFSPATNQWRELSATGNPQVFGATALVGGNRLVVWSGFEPNNYSAYLDKGGIYGLDTDTWAAVSTSGAPRPRGSHSMVAFGDEVVVVGGDCPWDPVNPAYVRCGDAARLNVASNTWRGAALPPPPDGPPIARNAATSAGNGIEFYVWGGREIAEFTPAKEGAIYDRVTDMWEAIPMAGQPVPRQSGFGAFGAGKFIVWDGYAFDSASENAGSTYDPVSRAWTPMATAPSTIGHECARVAWDGAYMIAFGGRSSAYTGARYDPRTNAWAVLPTQNAAAPSECPYMVGDGAGHTLVWRGLKRADGAIYSSATNTWSRVPDNGSMPPAVDYGGDGVWLGDRFGVLYGDIFSGIAHRLWLYVLDDAATGQWRRASTTDAPPENYDWGSAQWTGESLLVWRGGNNEGLPEAWTYDPVGDRWSPTPALDAPRGTSNASVARLGDRVAVWGAYPHNSGSLWREDTRTLPLVADLAVAVTTLPPQYSDEPGRFDIVVTNHGPEIATRVVLTARFNDDSGVVEATCGRAFPSVDIACALEALAPGQSVTIHAHNPNYYRSLGSLRVSVRSGGPESDPLPADNTDAVAASGIAIADATVTEGNAGTTNAVFTVTLSKAQPYPVTFDIATRTTATTTATAGTDYVALALQDQVIPAGQLSKTVNVVVNSDAITEPNEYFVVALADVVGAYVGDGTALAKIVDEDAPPTLSIADLSVTEGTNVEKVARFTVTLSRPVAHAVKFRGFSSPTPSDTAVWGSDYVGAGFDLEIPPGQTTLTFDIPLVTDSLWEYDETFIGRINFASGAAIADAVALATIVNDDPAALRIDGASVTEGDSGAQAVKVAVRLQTAVPFPVTVDVLTTGVGSASAGLDYLAIDRPGLTFAPGQTLRYVDAWVKGDTIDEPNEKFVVALANATNARIDIGASEVLIFDNDPARLSIADATLVEGNTGTKQLVFTVALESVAASAVSFTVSTTGAGTATANLDYAALGPTQMQIGAGQKVKTVAITINGDTAKEADERFVVAIGNVTGAVVVDGAALGTITNDD